MEFAHHSTAPSLRVRPREEKTVSSNKIPSANVHSSNAADNANVRLRNEEAEVSPCGTTTLALEENEEVTEDHTDEPGEHGAKEEAGHTRTPAVRFRLCEASKMGASTEQKADGWQPGAGGRGWGQPTGTSLLSGAMKMLQS